VTFVSLNLVAETEYAKTFDPRCVHPSRFGEFIHDTRFPDRTNGNQLRRVRCNPGELKALLEEIERLYRGTDLSYRKMSGHDPSTWDHLKNTLPPRGWSIKKESMKVLDEGPDPALASDLSIQVLEPDAPDLEQLFTADGKLDRGFQFLRTRYERLGGQYVVGYAGGEPVSTTGWYAVAGVARFRYVYTKPSARGRGYASSLIKYICSLPEVAAQKGIAIFVGAEGPEQLYEALGFRTKGYFFEALLGSEDGL